VFEEDKKKALNIAHTVSFCNCLLKTILFRLYTSVTNALEVFLNGVVRYLTPRFTYLLTYLLILQFVACVLAKFHTAAVPPFTERP